MSFMSKSQLLGFSTLTHVRKSYDIHEAFYLNREIHGPGSRVQAIGWGQYDPIVKMY